jgi:proline racemase
MKFKRMFTAVDSHTVGEPTRVVIGGIPHIPGKTIFEKKRYVETNMDDVRTLLMYEPRGHSAMSGSIVTAPCDPEADIGIVYIEVSGCLPMCGHGTIGTVTVLLETGIFPITGPEVKLVLDTPAGLVRATAECADEKVKSVTIQNVPSFVILSDVETDVEGIGRIKCDISYGGNFYAILPAAMAGVTIAPEHAGALVDTGRRIRSALNEYVGDRVVHPENSDIKGVSHVMFTADATNPKAHGKNMVMYGPGGLDRSPCGTGTSARMAMRFARGEQKLNEDFVHESTIGSLFTGRLLSETKVGPFPAVVPTIKGSAYITGIQQFLLDPDDPFPTGFLLG